MQEIALTLGCQVWKLGFLDFEIVSDFGFRISVF